MTATQIAERLNASSERMKARVRRNEEILEKVREETDWRKTLGYLKEVLGIKGGK